MGRDVEVADPGTVRQGERNGRFVAALSATRFQNVGDGAGAERVALEGARHRGGQFLRAVVIEQGQQAGGMDTK